MLCLPSSLHDMRLIHLLLVATVYCVIRTYLSSPPADGHLGRFPCLAVWSNPTMNYLVILFLLAVGCFPNCGISGTQAMHPLTDPAKQLSTVLVPICIPTSGV